MAQTKDDRIYIRVSEQNRIDFDLVAEHKGLTRSGFLHSLVVKAIYEARKESPEIFSPYSPTESLPTKVSDSEKKSAAVMTLDQATADDEIKKNKSKKEK